jgi:glycosyltransferase involved in cell wall biosynthesis
MARIAVDITPLLPGGINGGAKPMVVALLQELPRLLANDEFILWTADYNHEELAFLDGPNLKRVCVHHMGAGGNEKQSTGFMWFITRTRALAKRWIPERLKRWLRVTYYRARSSHLSVPFIKQQDIDFLFCPFSSTPIFYDPAVLTLCVIYDLQFLDYPNFFTESERFYRKMHFDQICHTADHIATISEFTRQSVLKNSNLLPEQITTIHIGLVHDYSNASSLSETQQVFERLKLDYQRYLFYPANFWAHKNHKALLEGFWRFREKFPGSDLKIVCTGALDDRRSVFYAEVEKLRLQQYIVTPGFLPDREIGFLYRGARGLIFPSLYEGFGIPLLEAMQAGIPIACSNVTSLPEIGGGAVFYFNPENISEITQAIEELEFNETLRNDLIQEGYKRLQLFGDAQDMAQNYGNLIHTMLKKKKKINLYGLHGMTEDQWFNESAYLAVPTSNNERSLEFSFHIPDWYPGKLVLTLLEANQQIAKYTGERGMVLHQTLELPRHECIIELHFSPVFTPANLGIADDHRHLGAICKSFHVKSSTGILLFDAFTSIK